MGFSTLSLSVAHNFLNNENNQKLPGLNSIGELDFCIQFFLGYYVNLDYRLDYTGH